MFFTSLLMEKVNFVDQCLWRFLGINSRDHSVFHINRFQVDIFEFSLSNRTVEETLPKGKALEGFVMTSIRIFTLH
jgi:hypothetical protein